MCVSAGVPAHGSSGKHNLTEAVIPSKHLSSGFYVRSAWIRLEMVELEWVREAFLPESLGAMRTL